MHACGWVHVCHTVAPLQLSGIDIYGLRIKRLTPPPTTAVTQTQTRTPISHHTLYSYSKTFRASHRGNHKISVHTEKKIVFAFCTKYLNNDKDWRLKGD